MLVIFDLDGTLSDSTHREHYVKRPVGQKDWDSFHAAAVYDPPKDAVLHTFLALQSAGHEIEIWTGRDEKYQAETLDWLAFNGIYNPTLKMRPTGDFTHDNELKSRWLDEHIGERGKRVNMVFEDRQRVVDMWRGRGITCAQIAPGNF